MQLNRVICSSLSLSEQKDEFYLSISRKFLPFFCSITKFILSPTLVLFLISFIWQTFRIIFKFLILIPYKEQYLSLFDIFGGLFLLHLRWLQKYLLIIKVYKLRFYLLDITSFEWDTRLFWHYWARNLVWSINKCLVIFFLFSCVYFLLNYQQRLGCCSKLFWRCS